MYHKPEWQDCMHTAHLLSESECDRPEPGPQLVPENWDLGASHLSLTVKENTCSPPGDLSVLLTWPHALSWFAWFLCSNRSKPSFWNVIVRKRGPLSQFCGRTGTLLQGAKPPPEGKTKKLVLGWPQWPMGPPSPHDLSDKWGHQVLYLRTLAMWVSWVVAAGLYKRGDSFWFYSLLADCLWCTPQSRWSAYSIMKLCSFFSTLWTYFLGREEIWVRIITP